MSDQQFQRAVRDWLEDGSDRTPRPAIDAVLLAVKTTPQERDLRIPWRFPQMPTYLRYAAGIAIVAVLGFAALSALGRGPGFGNTPTPIPTASPSTAPSIGATSGPAASPVASGIAAWTTYTSAVYGNTFGYPADWQVEGPATRKWQAGDRFLDFGPYSDNFGSRSSDNQIGLFVFQVAADAGTDLGSREGLSAFVCAHEASACQIISTAAQPMCLGKAACQPAVLVPLPDGVVAYFADGATRIVTVVQIGRPDSFPAAAPYGGSVQLLKSILTTMDVWPQT